MSSKLHYVLANPGPPITMNLFEAERYAPAVIVQQMVGNLVYYSNFGRYEPRLSESWERPDDFTWRFKIRKNLKCENGENITPSSFKKSLERSILIQGRKADIPILSFLSGYRDFLSRNQNKNLDQIDSLKGILSDENYLILRFDRKIRSGPLQILSFAPFGYICAKNLKNSGEWENNLQFISSGPYRLKELTIGKEYLLARNEFWPDFDPGAPQEILFSHEKENLNYNQPVILDVFTSEYTDDKLKLYRLVPEYLNGIFLGNLQNGFFKKKALRQTFKQMFNKKSKELLPENFGNNIRSNYFYPSLSPVESSEATPTEKLIPVVSTPLIIEGEKPVAGSRRELPWKVLKATLEELGLKYKFANNKPSYKELSNPAYDIRMAAPSIGGGAEAWGLFVHFCSSLGINLPDPDGRVCALIQQYENGAVGEADFAQTFANIVNDDAAALPLGHFGVKLFLSNHIDTSRLSQLLAILRIDQINIREE